MKRKNKNELVYLDPNNPTFDKEEFKGRVEADKRYLKESIKDLLDLYSRMPQSLIARTKRTVPISQEERYAYQLTDSREIEEVSEFFSRQIAISFNLIQQRYREFFDGLSGLDLDRILRMISTQILVESRFSLDPKNVSVISIGGTPLQFTLPPYPDSLMGETLGPGQIGVSSRRATSESLVDAYRFFSLEVPQNGQGIDYADLQKRLLREETAVYNTVLYQLYLMLKVKKMYGYEGLDSDHFMHTYLNSYNGDITYPRNSAIQNVCVQYFFKNGMSDLFNQVFSKHKSLKTDLKFETEHQFKIEDRERLTDGLLGEVYVDLILEIINNERELAEKHGILDISREEVLEIILGPKGTKSSFAADSKSPIIKFLKDVASNINGINEDGYMDVEHMSYNSVTLARIEHRRGPVSFLTGIERTDSTRLYTQRVMALYNAEIYGDFDPSL